ncbi:MAG: DUF3137 domain-containing protein [Tannerella sp.]|jgi:hypothetical protein|nr:DUF3137 domain-containing protein [Tannerella sp.]
MQEKIQQLQQALDAAHRRTKVRRRVLRISQAVCYGGSIVYFIGLSLSFVLCWSGSASFFVHDCTLNPSPTFWEANRTLFIVAPLILLITLGSVGVSYFYRRFSADEQNAVRRIIHEMFPDARSHIGMSPVLSTLLSDSHFFHSMSHRKQFDACSFGSIAFEQELPKLAIRDILIRKASGALAHTQIGALQYIFKFLMKAVFARRLENAGISFRGLFATARLTRTLQGSVVILPDRLERHLDYVALNIQALKNMNGNKLVHMEDEAFERHFVVYATDEILARYVLTPAMMLRMTQLRNRYGRDLMFSFNGARFFFAVAMPEGFLTLDSRHATDGRTVRDLYDSVIAAREILRDLKINKMISVEVKS